MADRQGIEIDYCPNCRGVWLDRGELDKIIERSASYVAKDEPPPPSQPYSGQPYYDNPKGGYNDPRYHHKKKKGFLSDFFDFD
jgi:uncharacterized protein